MANSPTVCRWVTLREALSTFVVADVTRYEAVALALVSPELPTLGDVIATYPRESSPLLIGDFFRRVYEQFDERFVYGAPDLAATTRRLEWDDASLALADPRSREYNPRVGA